MFVCMYVCVTLGSLGITYVSLWGHFGAAFGVLVVHCCVTCVSLWGHFCVILGSLWGHFGIPLASLLNHFWVTVWVALE